MARLVNGGPPLPGMASSSEAARFLVQHMLAVAGSRPGLHVFVTHDSVITATAAHMLGEQLGPADWPWYLEAAIFWREDATLYSAYRDARRSRANGLLCGFDERDMIELARREIAATLGLDCSARFFLAGGAFKALLTGHPPRDLDLWAPSPSDRVLLLDTLAARGARSLKERAFSNAFEVGDRVVEIAKKTEPPTLYTEVYRSMLENVAVVRLDRPEEIFPAYQHALERDDGKSTILVEWGDYYNEKSPYRPGADMTPVAGLHSAD